MSQKRTFKVIKWDTLPPGIEVVTKYDLQCICGREAFCPVADVGVRIESRVGMDFITDPQDPPEFFMPEEIKCRKCGRVFSTKKPAEAA